MTNKHERQQSLNGSIKPDKPSTAPSAKGRKHFDEEKKQERGEKIFKILIIY